MTDESNLTERIKTDLADAMRAGDKLRVSTLRLLRAAFQSDSIALRRDLTGEEAQSVLERQAKQRRDAMAAFEAGGRPDLVAKEQAELEIIEEYLPRQWTDDEIEAAAAAQIASVGAEGPSDIGKVMRPLVATIGAGADGRRVSAIVRRLLAPDG